MFGNSAEGQSRLQALRRPEWYNVPRFFDKAWAPVYRDKKFWKEVNAKFDRARITCSCSII